ncbi:PKD domain-containing protein [Algoriphagus litoralis]|uniref:PKD domain-containing protein n=1 Tax=Algoriphagus litoralis TaxID=2202829 RepID=UPI000DB9F7F2|nr:PKD domain-containing protein [Algoriphagus litoralis]
MNPKLPLARLLVVLFFALGNSFFAFAQLNTVGREFYVGFLENGRSLDTVNVQSEKAVLIITANEKTSGTITTPSQTLTFDLAKGQRLVKEFDAIREGLIHPRSEEVAPRFLHVVSTGNIALHALNGRAYSTGGTVVLPVESLGLDYMVMSHHERAYVTNSSLNHTTLESSMIVVGTEDDTEIEILPSARTTSGIPINYSLKITLNAGESYQLKSDGDLSGTRVKVLNDNNTNCKNVAVFAGNRMSSAGTCGTTGDHFFQQSYPTKTWGKSYVHIPQKDRTSGEFVKVLALENDTEVRVNGKLETKLNAGKFVRFEFGKNEVASIETSKPASVAVISKSGFCNEFFAASLGDPNFFSYSPNGQMIKEIQFSTGLLYGRFNLSIDHYLNILVPKGEAAKTVLNGQNIGSQFKAVPGANFQYAQIQIPEGVNSLVNSEGFIAYAYGSGQVESYGFVVGTGVESIQYETETTYPFEVIGDKVACLNQEGTWEIFPENQEYSEFTWSFGDGSPVVEGKEVSHTFQNPGKFMVSVLASTGEGLCEKEETFRFEVEVKDLSPILLGPESVCPLIDEFTYTLEDTTNLDRVEWTILGGTILEETPISVKVRWGAPNPNAKLSAIPYTDQGCPGEELILNVNVTETIEPGLPKGNSGLCGPNEVLVYEVPFQTTGRNYTWFVAGGNLISGQNSPQVEILWDLNASPKTIYYEETSTINGACAGTSEILEVIIYPEFQLGQVEMLNPACPGERNGRIQLNPTGGSGKYNFSWSHDPNLNGALAENLPSGDYEVTVSDQTGCAVEQLKLSLVEPETLRVDEPIESIPNTCFGVADGEFLIKPVGGNPPFTVAGMQSIWDGSTLQVFGVAPGSYQLLIQDSRGCSVTVDAELLGPEQISVLAKVENPGCEGSLDGVLELEIAGGTGPYTVLWDSGQVGTRLEDLPYGEFSYTVTDSNGCVATGVAVVNQASPEVRLPTGFDPRDGVFQPISNCTIAYEISIWDRWGGIIYFGTEGWNGLINGVEAPADSYSYFIRYRYRLEGKEASEEKRGSFTLIR